MSTDISTEIAALCERFGFAKENVFRIELNPRTATFDVYVLNEQGKKHIDLATDNAVMHSHTFAIVS
jgi:hypothetical protein